MLNDQIGSPRRKEGCKKGGGTGKCLNEKKISLSKILMVAQPNLKDKRI